MSIVLTGNSADVTTPLTATVTALSGSSGAIEATTLAPHLFATNDWVILAAGSTNATAQITVLDATHFVMPGTSFVATGSGTATDVSLTPQVQVPTDGDPQSVQLSGLLSAFRALLSRTQYLASKTAQQQFVSYLSAGTFPYTVPAGVNGLIAVLWGGGGGGGGGVQGDTTAGHASMGGSGGAGGRMLVTYVPCVPGGTLFVNVGAGGTGGTIVGNGGDGVSSSVVPVSGNRVLAPGGRGGYSGVAEVFASSNIYGWVAGASGAGLTGLNQPAPFGSGGISSPFTDSLQPLPLQPGDGGTSHVAVSGPTQSYDGLPNSTFAGGAGGNQGTCGTYQGGGGGGGGGAGPFGYGGAGGNGGNHADSGTGGAGTTNSVALPLAGGGGGGGGGGSGGGGSSSGGTAAPGQAGAGGGVILMPITYGAVVI